MAAKNKAEQLLGLYIDSSALAKLYVAEPQSDLLDAFLRGRRDLVISELSVTEVISAVARRRRKGAFTAKQANRIREAILSDVQSGSFRRLDLSPAIHREAEGVLPSMDSTPLRTLDAVHIARTTSTQMSALIA